jgi:1-acyl-sn-glycerol-3-phosphate acyltransferase
VDLTSLFDPSLDPSDPSHRDPEFIRTVAQPMLELLATYYFRMEQEGEDLIPRDGRFIAVANHNGGPILPDTWMMLSFWWRYFGPENGGYALVHDLPLRIPVMKNILLKVGALRAAPETGEKVIRLGQPLLIYPGGELDCLKSFWRRNTVDFHGRTGFIKLALQHGVPIVPVVSAGGHEVYFTLFSSRWLAEWSGLYKLTRVRTVPFNLGLPWGAWVTGFLPYLPLPAKFSYKAGEPIHLGHDPDAAKNRAVVQRAYNKVTKATQKLLDDLVRRRRFPVFG